MKTKKYSSIRTTDLFKEVYIISNHESLSIIIEFKYRNVFSYSTIFDVFVCESKPLFFAKFRKKYSISDKKFLKFKSVSFYKDRI